MSSTSTAAPLKYIMDNVLVADESSKDFRRMWNELAAEDRNELKAWAEAEQAVLAAEAPTAA